MQNSSSHDPLGSRIPRVAIVGVGFVGSTTAYALMMSGITAEIVLIDRDLCRADGQADDLRDAEVFSYPTRVFAADPSDCCESDITVVTAGVSQSGQKSRMDGLRETGAILHGLVTDVCRKNRGGILLIASSPVDVLTYAAMRKAQRTTESAPRRFESLGPRKYVETAQEELKRVSDIGTCFSIFLPT